MRARDDRWFENAIVYSLSVPHFFDADGDGVGDLAGVLRRLDHLVSLGVTCVWLLPFLESPRRDFGYDVADHYAVDRRLGTFGDVAALIRGAHQRNLRVIVDLALQHTSIDHPWFRAALRSRDDPRHAFYVWRDEPPGPDDGPEPVTWTGTEPRPWTFAEEVGRWYQHRFYWHEPDLNPLEPAVREELLRVLSFWLQLGVDGVRIDAGSHLTRAAAGAYGGDELGFMRELRRTASVINPDAVLVIEADVEPDALRAYFDGSEGGVLLFNFLLSSHFFLALARESAEPLARALRRLPPAAASGQWANFLRNHDELDLEQLAEDEREEVFARFAPEERMRIFGRGIRRRLGPMLGGDGPRLRAAYSAFLSLPGSPVLLWGDELPLGEELDLPDREAVRVAMPWSARDDLGFSAVPGVGPALTAVREGPFAPEAVNVADARRGEGSLLNWLAAAIRARREASHVGWGVSSVVSCDEPAVLAVRHDWQDEAVVVLTNLSPRPCRAGLAGCGDLREAVETFADRDYGGTPALAGAPVELQGHGYRWFRGAVEGGAPGSRAGGGATSRTAAP